MMKIKLPLAILLSLILQTSFSQNQSVEPDTVTEYDYWNYGLTYTVQAGIWKPLGNLEQTFNLNPNIAFKFGFPITREFRIDVGTTINIPINSEPFEYSVNDSTFNVNSKRTANGALGIWIGHEKLFKKQYFFDKYIGIGVGFIQTDKKKENSENEDDKWYSADTINFNFGLALRKKVFRKRSIGCFVEQNYAPYFLSKTVERSFGNSALISGIEYRF